MASGGDAYAARGEERTKEKQKRASGGMERGFFKGVSSLACWLQTAAFAPHLVSPPQPPTHSLLHALTEKGELWLRSAFSLPNFYDYSLKGQKGRLPSHGAASATTAPHPLPTGNWASRPAPFA